MVTQIKQASRRLHFDANELQSKVESTSVIASGPTSRSVATHEPIELSKRLCVISIFTYISYYFIYSFSINQWLLFINMIYYVIKKIGILKRHIFGSIFPSLKIDIYTNTHIYS